MPRLVTKPNIFIGSSREAMRVARAVSEQLSYVAQVTPWYAGTFGANEYTMDSLEKQLDRCDYGIFVFAPDDIALHRGKYVFMTRDNTLFEMGLFWGKLRRSRVFAIVPSRVEERDDLIAGEVVRDFHLLSDLQGMTLLKYDWRDDGNLTAAVDVACGRIADVIAAQGCFNDPAAVIAAKEEELQQKRSVLHFLWEFSRHVTIHAAPDPYQALSEAVRNSLLPPSGFRVTGAAFWQKKGADGLGHVGGNVGRGRFFTFSEYERKMAENDRKIYVLDVYLSGKWAFFKRRELAQVYVLCYPLGTEHVMSVHISGHRPLSPEELGEVVRMNDDLLLTIDQLVGGDTNET
ncbi:TIR domain-containing protein [Paenibacillus chartarius]|uniref:TIR domain-containing protein n=1 Tax=Paenibacillus chartarius TaxID=747481 RepID=A0ABV6DP54_9BACL